ncbi:TPA: hypothetical protein MIT56_23640 [Klebsiella pneumoniae]|nr:Uncharacterised protein [Klebsiella quasipneumoniae]HBX7168841.1 hypothetical protein [Klebsiella pneumoniae]HED3304473.1 hypothetical protein [Klebsiella quasipneumoniae subsp. similipneumoniae]VTM52175.1 Uncharacterised protein [Klebsiella quasipneumoniae]HBX7184265.1 hypothetical protein [Klebsiella pneumoniae]
MSQQSTMSRVSEKPFYCINGSGDVVNPDHSPSRLVLLKFGVKGRKVVINSLFIALALAPSKMKAQCIEVKLPLYTNNFSFPQAFQFGGKKQLYGVGNSIEFIKPVPGERSLIAIPQPKTKGNQGPDEHNQGRVGIEQQNELSPDASHKFWRLLLIQLSVFAAAFPAGVYISMRRNIRRDWRKHIPKGQLPKVPTLAMMSILCVSRRIKSHRWRLWEQRQWFRDMRVRYGIEVAYRDACYWKKLVTERWKA